MNFDWSSVKYIFQVPLEWFKSIHRRVFNAYGSNFILVKEGQYGGMEIGLDTEALNNQLSVDLTGVVKSIDNTVPDANGNIQLSTLGVVKSVDEIVPDTDGNVELTGVVKKVNGHAPDISGNVELSVVTLTGDQTIYGTKTFASNVYLSSQPGLPDANSLALATVGHVNTFYARKSHDHGNLNNDGTITNIGSGITKDYYIAADSNGDLYKSDLSSVLDGVVKSVNNVEPDGNGNVTIDVGGGGVSSVNGIPPDATGNVVLGDIVNSVEGVSPDQNGNVVLTSMVKSVNNVFPVNGNVTLNISSVTMQDVENYVEQQDFATETYVDTALTNYVDNTTLTTTLADYALTSDLEDYVQSVDGIAPVNGAIDFGLSASKWMKTDGLGHIGVTDEQPVAISSSANGYLYANNGSLEFKDDEFVTLSTEQTITGKKTFTSNNVTIRDESLLVVDSQSNNGTSVSKDGVVINSSTGCINLASPGTAANDAFVRLDSNDSNKLAFSSPNGIKGTSQHFELKGLNNSIIQITPDYGAIEIIPAVQAGMGGYIDFHFNGSSADYTSRILEAATGSAQVPNQLYITSKGNTVVQTETAGNKVFLIADANNVVLWNQPTDTSPSSLAVATVGYIQSKFQNAQTANINCVTSVVWNGTQIVIQSQTLGFTNGLLTSVTNNAAAYINTVAYST